ncbi:DUF1641 domain-containing protein [Aneurinibacillus sp. Ricciae_BoGa-3]|uniref:DUF1641 domain-containing protein n=1 Tax=Aneurinibacillus sp. Ricciae_BoGa-3 TaxID=3022697 RepID=UPI00234278EA|nr:DUF1641 domain-containing protein [Aneurinibacillus sp. Ricciae_BoGa-3]WCK55473.1 DUF1641 domain-containing protein [Aneurinibacillus sp. Ricciae_BoGa-3]
MAQPIKMVRKNVDTEEMKKEQALDNLRDELADKDEALFKIMQLIGELNDSGILEAANSLLSAKEKVAGILLGQVSRKPITNLINNLMEASALLTELNPESTNKIVGSMKSGLQKAQEDVETNKKVGVFELMKALNDPDINRALRFGMGFLKGLGQGLKD